MTCQEVADFYARLQEMTDASEMMEKTTLAERMAVRRHYARCPTCYVAMVAQRSRAEANVDPARLAELRAVANALVLRDAIAQALDPEA